MNPNAQAFPSKEKVTNEFGAVIEQSAHGLTTRDYIAIQMAKALIPKQKSEHKAFLDMCRNHGVEEIETAVCQLAYQYADALIAESNKK